MVAVCEGQRNERGEPFGADAFQPDGFKRTLSANLGHALAQLIARRLNLRTRSEKPGLLGRSSALFVSGVDRAEALLCGRAAVKAAVAGESGKMITLLRQEQEPYRSTTGLVELDRVAYAERPLPAEWIAEEGNDILPAFLDYVRPLTGVIDEYFRL